MAATVGATLSGVTFPLRHAGLGPYRSAAGNEYFFGRDSVNTGTVEPHKASDPMTAFTAQTAKLMSSGTTTAIEAMGTIPDESNADLIHVAAQIATGATYYNSYNMSTDAWTLTTSEVAVAAASFAPGVGFTDVSLAARSSGNVVFIYAAGLTAMSGFNMVRYRERTGVNTYGTAVNVDNGGTTTWQNGVAVLGAADRVHFFFIGSLNIYQRTLTAANALQTFQATFDVSGSIGHSIAAGVSYVSAPDTIVAVPYDAAQAGRRQAIARMTSSDAPTPSIETINNVSPASANSQILQALGGDVNRLHFLYVPGSDFDLYRDTDGGTGSWGTDVNELAGTINRVTANVYERPSGDKKLGMVVDDNATIKYAEIDLPEQGFPFESNPLFRRVLSLR